MRLSTAILQSFKYGCLQVARRKALLFMMVVMPIVCAWFMLDLMDDGTVRQVPVAIVNLDHSSMSRSLERNLAAMPGIEVTRHYENHAQAMRALQRGEIYGFFFIPARLEQLTLQGQRPVVSYYINYGYFIPSSSQLKEFTTVSMLANGAIAKTTLDATGLLDDGRIGALLQPILTHVHGINNPWAHYGYYLNLSFIPCLFALIIMLTTVTAVGNEFKYDTCRQWLANSGDSIIVALTGKLIPHTIIFMSVGWALQYMMFGMYHMPFNGNPWHMIGAMALLVPACQAFAVMVLGVAPNYRYAATICTLLGMLSFSFSGFSLPAEAMYRWVNAVGYVMPIRHFYIISVDQALNGIDIYYSRMHYAALVGYLLAPLPMLYRIKRECKNPVYVP